MAASTAVAVATGSFWKTTPVLVRGKLFLPEDNHRKRLVKVLRVSALTALNMSCGSVDDFECGNGDCINYSLTCDGMAHCKDKSDEKQSYCGERSGPSHVKQRARFDSFRQFLAAVISLILEYLQYSKLYLHLPSTANRICKKGYRRCINGRCIGHQFWCDGTDDCGDHSDEVPCNSKPSETSLFLLDSLATAESLVGWCLFRQ